MELARVIGYTNGSGTVQTTTTSSTVAAKWPEAIDVNVGILKPEVAASFKRQVISALRSRGLYEVLQYEVPSVADLVAANPGMDVSRVTAKQQELETALKRHHALVADNLPPLIKGESLNNAEQSKLNAFVTDGDGPGLFAWMMELIDLSKGRAQDKVRKAYTQVKVTPSDGGLALSTAIETKWWLYKQNTLYSTGTQSGIREGIRDIITMLLDGPPRVSARPTPLFTDNDGTWYISRDAASTTSMVYIIRHVRFIQQAVYDKEVRVFQVDGELNPPDALTKHKSSSDYKRHMAVMMGFPQLALQIWRTSPKYLKHRAKKIVPVSPLQDD